ncbi:MAG: tRNA uridine-5-carboxymethylaminomethyl(34) synthesis GTPase MnmE [Bacillaceae bacterium G1]|nr:tRNA uridine-5-carboxymethylaminomethyl(34) synthesis GTPase MnmE [Bacillota bacterium]OJF17946.1 MAG: tRNA uridine-5-carboxymethylaminomethyl(34) synthesis GTPase MnmE [Bacillaceae bacterium G1]
MVRDTIAAISTALGEAAIAIVRVSGPEAVAVVDRLFRGRKPLLEVPSHTIHYGHLIDPATGEKMEEVLVTVMRAPRTFTGEDVVEINCHGGVVGVQQVLQLVLDAGARLAEPGEFTKRAFLNGRIDLAQAEAVIDLIRAKSERAMRLAVRQVDGQLSAKIRELRQRLLALLAHVEVNIDYPEYDVEELTRQHVAREISQLLEAVGALLTSARQGRVLREGITTAIVGRPNVGKSSLLNRMARANRAIVTDIPGTTRDIIEELVTVRGIPLRLVDTAGIRETTDVVEQIGVQRSRQALEEAELVLLVLNGGEALTAEDRQLMELLKGRETIVVVNKADLPRRLDVKEVEAAFPGRVVLTSTVADPGLAPLEDKIAELFFSGQVDTDDMTYVSNVRHIQLLKEAQAALSDALGQLEAAMPVDVVTIDLQRAWSRLGEIVGEEVSEALLDQIFSQFCLGK